VGVAVDVAVSAVRVAESGGQLAERVDAFRILEHAGGEQSGPVVVGGDGVAGDGVARAGR
jgi:hypothetical protein